MNAKPNLIIHKSRIKISRRKEGEDFSPSALNKEPNTYRETTRKVIKPLPKPVARSTQRSTDRSSKVNQEEKFNIVQEESSSTSDLSESDEYFEKEAQTYLRKKAKAVLNFKPADLKKSRQKPEEFKSNQPKTGTSLISHEIINEAPDADLQSVNTELYGLSKRMNRDDLMKCRS